MNDLISRQAAINALAKLVPYAIYDESTESYRNGLTDAHDLICLLPSAQPEKTGKWIQTIKHHKDDEQEYDYIEYNCSECGVRRKIGWRDANYCPMCGAKMEMNDEN